MTHHISQCSLSQSCSLRTPSFPSDPCTICTWFPLSLFSAHYSVSSSHRYRPFEEHTLSIMYVLSPIRQSEIACVFVRAPSLYFHPFCLQAPLINSQRSDTLHFRPSMLSNSRFQLIQARALNCVCNCVNAANLTLFNYWSLIFGKICASRTIPCASRCLLIMIRAKSDSILVHYYSRFISTSSWSGAFLINNIPFLSHHLTPVRGVRFHWTPVTLIDHSFRIVL